jgi:hypothetical protein
MQMEIGQESAQNQKKENPDGLCAFWRLPNASQIITFQLRRMSGK